MGKNARKHGGLFRRLRDFVARLRAGINPDAISEAIGFYGGNIDDGYFD